MSYFHKDLINEIKETVQEQIRSGEEVETDWLEQAILAAHEELSLSDFSVCARNEFVKAGVMEWARLFKKKELEPRDDRQPILEGLEYLQVAYLHVRNNVRMISPVEKMTNAELKAKADEHRSQADGNNRHADEIERYIKQRSRSQAV